MKSLYKQQIIDMGARGFRAAQIAERTGCSVAYAEFTLSGSTAGRDLSMPSPEDHERHVTACLAHGGFPVSIRIGATTRWYWPARAA